MSSGRAAKTSSRWWGLSPISRSVGVSGSTAIARTCRREKQSGATSAPLLATVGPRLNASETPQPTVPRRAVFRPRSGRPFYRGTGFHITTLVVSKPARS